MSEVAMTAFKSRRSGPVRPTSSPGRQASAGSGRGGAKPRSRGSGEGHHAQAADHDAEGDHALTEGRPARRRLHRGQARDAHRNSGEGMSTKETGRWGIVAIGRLRAR